MSVLLVTPCTNRKLGRARTTALSPSLLRTGPQECVTTQWLSLVQAASDNSSADNLYGGRGFKEALATVAPHRDRLWIISAGLGLIHAQAPAPAYNLTVTPGHAHSVQSRISGKPFCARSWWADLNARLREGFDLATFVRSFPRSTVVVTLSAAYTTLVSSDLLQLAAHELSQVRIVGPASVQSLPEPLHPYWMPYDVRFDGPDSPLPGTRADYPQRVARHFVAMIERGGSEAGLADHRAAVTAFLRELTPPLRLERVRMDDDSIRAAILEHWSDARGSSARMLRILRDEKGISCEQGRFAKLFRALKQGTPA
jgi:hypothetical protein